MRWLSCLALWAVCCALILPGVQARDSHVNEMLLSLAHPSDVLDPDEIFDTDIEKTLSDSFLRIGPRRETGEMTRNEGEVFPARRRNCSWRPSVAWKQLLGYGRPV